MRKAELREFLERAKSQELCAAFYVRASGELVTADTLPADIFKRKFRQAGVSIAAASAMALAAGCASTPGTSTVSQSATAPEVQPPSPDAAPDEDVIELMAFGIICTPEPPDIKRPASKRL